jgi:hypothetical protein
MWNVNAPARLSICILLTWGSMPARALPAMSQVRQPKEVVEAYAVCETFEHLLGENLDFDRAYEATFTRNPAQRRAIAIVDGEFGHLDYDRISDALLIKGYKLRMQIFYLTLVLSSPSDQESPVFFPPEIKEILKRPDPKSEREFGSYVAQLETDASRFRNHLARLAAKGPAVSKRLTDFKSAARSARFTPPTDHKIEPVTGYYRSQVLGNKQPYYEIAGYHVARDQSEMRIIGIRFFTRLF